MWTLYFTGTTAIVSLLFYNFRQQKKQNISYKFAVLIWLCRQLDKKMVFEDIGNDSMTFETSNRRGTLLLVLTQFNSIICVELERITADNTIDNQEWYFLNNGNQKWMFHKIISDIIATKSGILKENTLAKLLEISSDYKSDKEYNFYNKHKAAQSLYCIAYDSVKKFPRYKYLSKEGRFEMLLFNCVFLLNRIPVGIKQQSFTREIIPLLLFYLEKHHSMNHIKDIQDFMDSRFSLYMNQIDQMRHTNDLDYGELYHFFIVKPLSSKVKHKYKEIEDVTFKNSILLMIKNMEKLFDHYYGNLKMAGNNT